MSSLEEQIEVGSQERLGSELDCEVGITVSK